MERKVGEVFEYNGKKYIVKEIVEGCAGCAFYDDCIGLIGRGHCSEQFRSDHKSVIFIEYKEEKVMENLLNCKGRKFKCKMDGIYVEGRIQVEKKNMVFLCQNIRDGGECEDKLGYTYSWYVGTGDKDYLLMNKITNFEIVGMTKEEIENYKDWQVGDKIIHKDGTKGEIIFRSGKFVVFTFNDNVAYSNFTINGLYNRGWRLDEKPIEESFVEMTMEEIAKLKGIPVEKLRIKDK